MQKIGSVQRVCEIFRLKIHAGELSPGEKLPSTRALASDLGVSRSTVVVTAERILTICADYALTSVCRMAVVVNRRLAQPA